MISQRSRYALKALIRLARVTDGAPLAARDIAQTEQIPHAFLEQIMMDLKRARLVTSRRGKEGGYVLALSPRDISLAAILRLVDGPVAPLTCLSRTAYRRCDDCNDEASCALRQIFADTHSAMMDVLEKRNLAETIARADLHASEAGAFGADVFSGAFI